MLCLVIEVSDYSDKVGADVLLATKLHDKSVEAFLKSMKTW